MAITKASYAEHHPAGPSKNSSAQKKQQELFRLLGSVARDKANLYNLANTSYLWAATGHGIILTQLEKQVLNAALWALTNIEGRAREEMKKLPNKKRLKEQEKELAAQQLDYLNR